MGSKVIVITGANGLLGFFATTALAKQWTVYAIIRNAAARPIPGVAYTSIDLASEWSPSCLPAGQIDIIIHLAQSVHFRDFPDQALDVFRVNVDSTAKLLDFAQKHGVKKFIYASSGGVYGNGPGEFHENSPITSYRDLGYYLGSKVCGEVLVQSYAAFMDVTILRPFFMYGSGQRRSMLIPRLVDSVREGRPITYQGSEGIRINPVHVSDAVALLLACINQPGSRIINVAGPDVLSIKQVAEIIGDKLGMATRFEQVQGEPRDLIGNNTLMQEMLARPLVGFRKGVEDVFTLQQEQTPGS